VTTAGAWAPPCRVPAGCATANAPAGRRLPPTAFEPMPGNARVMGRLQHPPTSSRGAREVPQPEPAAEAVLEATDAEIATAVASPARAVKAMRA
jgi:hypothetical protein